MNGENQREKPYYNLIQVKFYEPKPKTIESRLIVATPTPFFLPHSRPSFTARELFSYVRSGGP